MTNERLIEYLKLAQKKDGTIAFDDEKIKNILNDESLLNHYKRQFENFEAYFYDVKGESYDLLEDSKKRR